MKDKEFVQQIQEAVKKLDEVCIELPIKKAIGTNKIGMEILKNISEVKIADSTAFFQGMPIYLIENLPYLNSNFIIGDEYQIKAMAEASKERGLK